MNISDKAVDEAYAAFTGQYDRELIRDIAEAAAPIIAAQTLRDAADGIGGQPGHGEYYQGMDAAAASLRDRADELEEA